MLPETRLFASRPSKINICQVFIRPMSISRSKPTEKLDLICINLLFIHVPNQKLVLHASVKPTSTNFLILSSASLLSINAEKILIYKAK